jgi:DNA-binding protein
MSDRFGENPHKPSVVMGREAVKDYLLAVLPGMHHRTLSEVSLLAPARWKRARV